LVELGGGEWGLVAQCRPAASPRSFSAMGVRPGLAGEEERGPGEVGLGLSACWGRGGVVVVVLASGWG
jgi:hypothetical protein